MIIKTRNLKTFCEQYDNLIGTDYEWEKWDNDTTHIYAFDIETQKESNNLDMLRKKYNFED